MDSMIVYDMMESMMLTRIACLLSFVSFVRMFVCLSVCLFICDWWI